MSRVAFPSEKVMAVAGIYQALIDELHLMPHFPTAQDRQPGVMYTKKDEPMTVVPFIDPRVTAALIDASVRIAMATDTRDMGVMASPPPPQPEAPPYRDIDMVNEGQS